MPDHESPAAPPRETEDVSPPSARPSAPLAERIDHALATNTPTAWAEAKKADPFLVAGAVGRERAAGRWALHTEPDVTEAEFDAAVAAFSNLELG